VIRRALVLALALPAVAAARPVTELHYVMGTYFRITVDEGARGAARECFREARRLEAVFSRFDPGSELSRVNAAAGRATRVSDDMAALLGRAARLTAATGGAFDVTVGGVTALWRAADAPSPDALRRARAGVGPTHARLAGRLLRLAPGTRLDFDGVAKGWAVDACVARLRAAGVGSALVSLGESSVYALGAPPGAAAWRLALRGTDPSRAVGVLRLRDAALSVSATRGPGGRPHIVDPRRGRPLGEPAVAAIVAGSATDAEAWSKALLLRGAGDVAGVERAAGVGAIAVDAGAVHAGRRGRAVFAALPTPLPLTALEEDLS
jgi:thiamine biosynthesis lipoprotein